MIMTLTPAQHANYVHKTRSSSMLDQSNALNAPLGDLHTLGQAMLLTAPRYASTWVALRIENQWLTAVT
jgi:hypothetical protein